MRLKRDNGESGNEYVSIYLICGLTKVKDG